MKDLLGLPASQWLEELAAADIPPAAGSAAALTAALAAALCTMVARLTAEKAETGPDPLRARYGPYASRAQELAAEADRLRVTLQELIQQDAELVEALLASRRRESPEPGSTRHTNPDECLDLLGGKVPLRIAQAALEVAVCAEELYERGYRTAAEDVRTARLLALAAARSAAALAAANLKHSKSSPAWLAPLQEECRALAWRIQELEERTNALA